MLNKVRKSQGNLSLWILIARMRRKKHFGKEEQNKDNFSLLTKVNLIISKMMALTFVEFQKNLLLKDKKIDFSQKIIYIFKIFVTFFSEDLF